MSSDVRTAPIRASPIILAATATARKCQWRAAADVAGGARGRTLAGPLFPRRVHAAGRNRRHRLPEQGARSMDCCSRPPPRRSPPSPPTPSISAPRSASLPCCTAGARTSITIPLCGAPHKWIYAERRIMPSWRRECLPSSPHRVEFTPHNFWRGRPGATLPKACPAPGSGQA